MSVAQGDVGDSGNTKKPIQKSVETNGSPVNGGANGGGSYEGRSGNGSGDRQYSDRGERTPTAAMEVPVDNNIERAMKVLKRKLIKEGLFKELKSRRYYEKPCERRKRKLKESIKKARKEEIRQKRNSMLIA